MLLTFYQLVNTIVIIHFEVNQQVQGLAIIQYVITMVVTYTLNMQWLVAVAC